MGPGQARGIVERIQSRLFVGSEKPRPDSVAAFAAAAMPAFDFGKGTTDLDLFLLMVILNRPALAKLFWFRDGRQGPFALLHAALLAVLLSRRLVAHPVMGRHRRLLSRLRATARDFEGLAARVLRRASATNQARTLAALEQPLTICESLDALDLVARADCRALVSECPTLLRRAAQARFFGPGGVTAAVLRARRSANLLWPAWSGWSLKPKLAACVVADVVGLLLHVIPMLQV